MDTDPGVKSQLILIRHFMIQSIRTKMVEGNEEHNVKEWYIGIQVCRNRYWKIENNIILLMDGLVVSCVLT